MFFYYFSRFSYFDINGRIRRFLSQKLSVDLREFF